MAPVVLQNLVKIYPDKTGGEVPAVNRINLTIKDGEFMVLVGPSGCGKSTTLRMIAGLEDITSGTIAIDGQIVNQVPPKDRDIAMVFQNYALYPHLSVYDNLAFGLKLRKLPRKEIDFRVREAAVLLGLEPYLDRKPKALSGGQRQRVAVGRAIVRQPKVFLFDEPLSNLDAKMRVSTRAEISRLHARLGATMVYVTHDQVEAMTMGDRICVMKDGNIMQVAEPLELYRHPANLFVARFIGSPAMNCFTGQLRASQGRVHFSETDSAASPLVLTLPEPLAARAAAWIGKPVVLGIRPEHVVDTDSVSPADPAHSFLMKVELSEPMGAETFLYLHSGATPFVGRVRAESRFEPDQRVPITFQTDHLHLFDAETERAI